MKHIISEEIKNNIYLHTIKENKFKTNVINFYFQRPLIREEVTYNAILPMVMQRGTKEYKTSKEINKKLEALYGANISGDVTKKGGAQIIRFSLTIMDDIYAEGENLLYEGIKLLNSILADPILENDGFLNTYVAQEKENLRSQIEGRMNDKMKYAVDRCIEIMCENEQYGIYEYGYTEDLDGMTPQKLYDHYKKVISSGPLDIIAVGNIDHIKIKESLLRILTLQMDHPVNIKKEADGKIPKEIKEKEEIMDINQGKLTLGYRTNISLYDKRYPALMVYSNILGGGPQSKLFLNMREKNSLCYYIFSRVEKYAGLMLISSGIEVENFHIAKAAINDQMLEMMQGNIQDSEIEYAKKSIINSIREFGDHSNSLAEYLFGQLFANNVESLEELIKKIERVTKDEVITVAPKIKLDTIYSLRN